MRLVAIKAVQGSPTWRLPIKKFPACCWAMNDDELSSSRPVSPGLLMLAQLWRDDFVQLLKQLIIFARPQWALSPLMHSRAIQFSDCQFN